MKELFELFVLFMKIGGLTFGGGYAMLPMLQQELVERRGWVTENEMMDYYAIGQCTPGIIAVNVATFVGNKRKGVIGAAFATFGMVFPSLVIIIIIAGFLRNFADMPLVKHAFAGIRLAVGALVVDAIIKLWKSAMADVICIVMFVAVFILSLTIGMSPVIIVILSGLAGIAINKFIRRGCGLK